MINKVYFEPPEKELLEIDNSEFYTYKKKLFENFGDNLEFKPGINILFGNNACGKSSLLRMIARETFSYQGYIKEDYSGWTKHIFEPNYGLLGPKDKSPKYLRKNEEDYFLDEGKVHLDWNGALTFYRDSTKANQVLVNQLGQLMPSEISNLPQFNFSSKGMHYLNNLKEIIEAMNNAPSIDDYKLELKNYRREEITSGKEYDFALKDFEFWKSYIKSLGHGTTPTFLLDEPDSHLSFIYQFHVWKNLVEGSKKNGIQLIVASHSPIPLFLKDANIISFEKDYAKYTKHMFEKFVKDGDFDF